MKYIKKTTNQGYTYSLPFRLKYCTPSFILNKDISYEYLIYCNSPFFIDLIYLNKMDIKAFEGKMKNAVDNHIPIKYITI